MGFSLVCLVCVVLCCCLQGVRCLQGLYSVKTDSRLTDFVLKSQRIAGIQTCAHICTINAACKSINYKHSTQERGLCELNSKSADQDNRGLRKSPGWSFGYLVEQTPDIEPTVTPSFVATFTCLGATHYTGPTSTDGYAGTRLEGQVELKDGIQIWKVPYTGQYRIEAFGAAGGNGTNETAGAGWRLGGQGARAQGTFQLTADTKLKILIGQKGGASNEYPERPGGGGGGTFVILLDNTVLLIAGGGGGGAGIFPHADCKDGDPGQSTGNGTRHGGTRGSGGKRYDKIAGYEPRNLEGTGGGGFLGDGSSSSISAEGGRSFTHGGRGGMSRAGAAHGGFGGGGAGTAYPGGGGGYSGGGVVSDGKHFSVAGGGGSYNNGNEQDNQSGVNKENGKLVVRLLN